MKPRTRPARPPAAADPLTGMSVLIEAMLHAVWLVEAKSLCIVGANRAAGVLLGETAAVLQPDVDAGAFSFVSILVEKIF